MSQYFKTMALSFILQAWTSNGGLPPPVPVFSGLLTILTPVVGGLLVLGIGCLMFVVMMVRKKRSLHGTYNPQKQEYGNGPRFEMTDLDMLKKPAEERLI